MKNSGQLKSEKKMVLAVLTVMLLVVNAFMLYISWSKAKTNMELIAAQIVSVIGGDVQNNSSIASSLGAMLQLSNAAINKTLDINLEEAIDTADVRWSDGIDAEHRKKFTILRSFWRSFSSDNKSRFSTYYTDGDSGYYYDLNNEKVLEIQGNNPHFRLSGYLRKTAMQLKNSHGFMVPELFYSNVYDDAVTKLPSITIGVPVVINNFSSQLSTISGIIATDYTSADLTQLFHHGFHRLKTNIEGYDISMHSVQPNDIPMNIFAGRPAIFGFSANHIALTSGYYLNTNIHLSELIGSKLPSFVVANLMMAFFFLIFLKAHRNSALMMSKLTTDSLTQALSREGGRGAIERLKESDNTALVVIDLNDFKLINDTYGHQIGDEALVFFSRYIMKDIRSGDALIRMGGDEFVLLLQNMSIEQAGKKLAVLQHGLHSFSSDQKEVPLSFSFGISAFCGDFTDSYKQADENLYQMKKERKVCR